MLLLLIGAVMDQIGRNDPGVKFERGRSQTHACVLFGGNREEPEIIA